MHFILSNKFNKNFYFVKALLLNCYNNFVKTTKNYGRNMKGYNKKNFTLKRIHKNSLAKLHRK